MSVDSPQAAQVVSADLPPVVQQIQLRRGTDLEWTAADPVLLEGEVGIETNNNGRFKVGNGADAWNDLPYASGPPGAVDIYEQDTEPMTAVVGSIWIEVEP